MSILGIQRAKLDVLHATDHPSPPITERRSRSSAVMHVTPELEVLGSNPGGVGTQCPRRYGVCDPASRNRCCEGQLGITDTLEFGERPSTLPPITAVLALRCPSWAFGEPSWTCYTPLTTHHSSPGVTVSILGIRRAKLDVLHATDHPSQQFRRYGVHLGHSASQAGRATRH